MFERLEVLCIYKVWNKIGFIFRPEILFFILIASTLEFVTIASEDLYRLK